MLGRLASRVLVSNDFWRGTEIPEPLVHLGFSILTGLISI
jgi:hypothetical protein